MNTEWHIFTNAKNEALHWNPAKKKLGVLAIILCYILKKSLQVTYYTYNILHLYYTGCGLFLLCCSFVTS